MLTGQGKREGKSKKKNVEETIAEKLVRVAAPQAPAKHWGGKVINSMLFNKTWEEEMAGS